MLASFFLSGVSVLFEILGLGFRRGILSVGGIEMFGTLEGKFLADVVDACVSWI